MSEFEAWIGREQRARDQIDDGLSARWLATFDLPHGEGEALPQGIHFVLCTPEAMSRTLGEDGHPTRDNSADSFLPPFPMPRRMWASSAIDFHTPITRGASIDRTSRVALISQKQGKSGPLAFVDVAHETFADGTLAVSEKQTLVYRDAAASDAPLSPPEPGDETFDSGAWDAASTHQPDPRLLFRYSALTFNTHRIHYDAPYASAVERYRGLVVHGPLTASLLLQLAARELGHNALGHFAFRGMSPAIADEPLHCAMRANADGFELGAFASDGRQVMQGRAKV